MNAGELVRAMLDAANEGDINRSAAAFAEDSQIIDVPTRTSYRGPEGWKQFLQLWASNGSNPRADITHLFATEDEVVVEYVGRGNHTGNVHSNYGHLAHPTIEASAGQPLEMFVCLLAQVKQGKIVRCSTYYCVMDLMRPAAALPEMEHVR